MSGVTFGIYSDEDCTEAVGDLITIENKAVVVELDVGIYYVKVVDVPDGYVLSDSAYSIDIVEDDTVELVVEIEIFELKRTDFTPSDLTELFATEIDEYYHGNVWSLVTNKRNVSNVIVGDWISTEVSGYTYDMEIACINCYEGECYDNTNPVYDGSGDGAVTKVPSHIDIISKQLYSEDHVWNDASNCDTGENYNNGSANQQCPWLHSTLYLYLQDTVFPLLPQQLQNAAIEKCMLIEQKYDGGNNCNEPTGECWQPIGKLWLPNEMEIYGQISYSSSTYGAYGIRYETLNTLDKHIKCRPFSDSSEIWWSLSTRTATTSGGYQGIIIVSSTGSDGMYNAATNSFSFPLCIRLELK